MKSFQLAAILVIALLALGLYRAKTEAEAARARVETLEAEAAAMRGEVDLLEAEAAHLARPERIDALARERLDMAPAEASEPPPP